MTDIKKGDLATCRICNVTVTKKRLSKHLFKVHGITDNKRKANNNKQFHSFNWEKNRFEQQFDSYYEQICHCINKHMIGDYSPGLKRVFTIMFLIKNCNYSKTDVKSFYPDWDEKDYTQKYKKFRDKFDTIELILLHGAEDQEADEEELPLERSIKLEELYGYEPRFGKKYLGYLRREYQGSRFGSYPLHDDYGEESDPEGSTNLDY